MNKYTESIECFNKTLAIDPLNASALNGKGVAFKCSQKYLNSINCFNQAIAINPHYSNALNNRELTSKMFYESIANSFDILMNMWLT